METRKRFDACVGVGGSRPRAAGACGLLCVLTLSLALGGCATQVSAGGARGGGEGSTPSASRSGGPPGPASAPTRAPTQAPTSPIPQTTPYATTAGGATCPGGVGSASAAGTPALILGPSAEPSSGSAPGGSLVQVRLPSTANWRLVSMSGTSRAATLLSPAGFEDPALQLCIWNFMLPASGTVTFVFDGTSGCSGREGCPQGSARRTYTVTVG